MSFDIFLQAAPGEALDRSMIERAFGDMIVGNPADDFWNLCGPEGEMYLANVFVGGGARVDGFMVAGPPDTPEFWGAIFEILRQSRSYLVWPAAGPLPTYCVADPDWRSFLPDKDFEHLGPPALVGSAADSAGHRRERGLTPSALGAPTRTAAGGHFT
jgi:hypothetical protein